MFMVFESSLNGKNKSGLKIFFFFGWATNWAQALNGARGTRRAQLGQVRASGKNPVP